MASKVLVLTIFCYFNLALAKPQYQYSLKGFWENAKPGELLRSLDTITSTAQHLTAPTQKEKDLEVDTTPEQSSKIPLLQRRIGDRSVESFEQKSPYDYDKAYDEFVKKYFDDSVADALSASESSENTDTEQQDAEAYSGEEEVSSEADDDPVSEASKKTAKAQKCKNSVRGQQNCLICKNSRTGENSESCSLNKETKPQSFEFEKQKNYRKYRATPKSNESEDSREHDSSVNASNASLRKPIRHTINKSNDSSSCTMKKFKNKVCFHCENGKGEKITKCYAEELPITADSKGQTRDERNKLKKTHQRIYKRTISYTYENIPHNVQEQQIKHNYSDVLDKPLVQKHFIL